MLETQMIHQEAVQYHRFENYLLRHCLSWHAFARSLDIRIGFGDLMLVTECSKTAAWSSAVYSNNSTEFSLSFSVGIPFSAAGMGASSSIERIGPIERRRSQRRAQFQGPPLPNTHTVFIKAYRLGTRQAYYQSLVYLFMKAKGPSLRGNRDATDSGNSNAEGDSQAATGPVTSPSYSVRPLDYSETIVVQPSASNFHRAITLLGLAMETSDSECVVIHDDLWCSTGPDSDESRIIDEYTSFYFDKGVDDALHNARSRAPRFDADVESLESFDGSSLDPRAPATLDESEDGWSSLANDIIPPSQAREEFLPVPLLTSFPDSSLDEYSMSDNMRSILLKHAQNVAVARSDSDVLDSEPEDDWDTEILQDTPSRFSPQLKRYQEARTTNKPYLCDGGCGKVFTGQDALRRHQFSKKCGKVDGQRSTPGGDPAGLEAERSREMFLKKPVPSSGKLVVDTRVELLALAPLMRPHLQGSFAAGSTSSSAAGAGSPRADSAPVQTTTAGAALKSMFRKKAALATVPVTPPSSQRDSSGEYDHPVPGTSLPHHNRQQSRRKGPKNITIPLGYPWNLPPAAPPSSPRTTRRLMLQTDMSEDLKSTLLLEREVDQVKSTGLRGAAGSDGNLAEAQEAIEMGSDKGTLTRNRSSVDD